MTTEIAIGYLIGSWGIGFMVGLVLRLVTKLYTEWFA